MEQILRVGMTRIVIEHNVKEIGGLPRLFRNVAGIAGLSNTGLLRGPMAGSFVERSIEKKKRLDDSVHPYGKLVHCDPNRRDFW